MTCVHICCSDFRVFSFFFFLFEAGSCFVHQKAFNLQLSSCLCLPRAGCQHASPQLAPSSSLNSALPNAFLLADRGWVATRLRENLPCKCEALGSISGRQRKEKTVVRDSRVAQQAASQASLQLHLRNPWWKERTPQSCSPTSPHELRATPLHST